MSSIRIADVRVTPIAFYDPPLLNNAGCHQPLALRSIIEVETDGGVIGLGESYGDEAFLTNLNYVASGMAGLQICDIDELWTRVRAGLPELHKPDNQFPRELARIVAAVEVAMWDAFGKSVGQRVCDLLGGQIRQRVPFSAYLFYKLPNHRHESGPDDWGEALTPDGLVAQARRMRELHGFNAIKLKAGVFEPAEEIEGLRALRDAFPEAPLRIDPNGGWRVETAIALLPQLTGLIEYLEDPTTGMDGNARVQASTDIPLATNMYVVEKSHLEPNVQKDAFRVILSDHHYWGGLRSSRYLARHCEEAGRGLSMHSNSHLGISLAAMTHLAAATPNLTYDCDTHYPWQRDEVIEGGKLAFREGALSVPEGPGLGVTLDRDALKRLHENYLNGGVTSRDDATEMKKYWPEWEFGRPKF